MTSGGEEQSQEVFQKFKALCVPLLGHSSLSPTSVPAVSKLLEEIALTLRLTQQSGFNMKPSLISYIFFPVSMIIRRNPIQAIPDRILEEIFTVLALLCESWWWTMDEPTWEQLFLLASTVIGGLEGKGKDKQRSDETRAAAANCLWALLHERTPDEAPQNMQDWGSRNLAKFRQFSHQEKILPVMGHTINSLLSTSESQSRPLQKTSLDVLDVLIRIYLPDDFVPSILPGVVSSMCKVALGRTTSRGWASGEIVASSLKTMQEVIVKSVGDEICLRVGAIQVAQSLDDLTQLGHDVKPPTWALSLSSKYAVDRTPSWLSGTTSQLHIALNSLHPLISHPTASALVGLVEFSAVLLRDTLYTLPQSQPLLLSFLFALSISDFSSVSEAAHARLLDLLQRSSTSSATLLPVLLQVTKDNLSALQRLLPLHADARIEHAAKIVSSVFGLAKLSDPQHGMDLISQGVGRLLGSSGGIERWGWGLLSVMELSSPVISHASTSTGLLVFENDPSLLNLPNFPPLLLRHVSAHSTQAALESMFQSMGRAAGENALFAIEWFLSVGYRGRGSQSVSALWCACRLLEGVSSLSLASGSVDSNLSSRSRRLEKFSRGLTRTIADEWEREADGEVVVNPIDDSQSAASDVALIEHVRGMIPVRETPQHQASLPSMNIHPSSPQKVLRKVLLLQLLSLAAGILQARFTPLLLHALYPILHSLTSPVPVVSSTALASLHYTTNAISYATPANMLLSNFDYALDAVSRHLTRRWLDVDATRVLAMLIRLVGRDVVQKAGDVVEECFDRLDEYHGYEVIVDGLVSVLGEVVVVIATDAEQDVVPEPDADSIRRHQDMQDFLEWFSSRHRVEVTADEDTEMGPVPQRAWGEDEMSGVEESARDEVTDPLKEPPITPTQALTTQIVSRSMYFLTHDSSLIRTRILSLLGSAAAVLPGSALLPSIHQAWPFILNRMSDAEPFVVSAAVPLVAALAIHYGEFMYRRIWDDVWPRFKAMLSKLELADTHSALARRGYGAVGTESAHTYSHRTYKALLTTMCSAAKHVQAQDSSVWEVVVSFRRFLHAHTHEELQALARDLYTILSKNNEDAVWFALTATQSQLGSWTFLREDRWQISDNVSAILAQ